MSGKPAAALAAACAATGMLIALLVLRQRVVSFGYSPAEAGLRAIALALILELVWLPSLAAAFIGQAGGGVWQALAAGGGGLAALVGFALFSGVPPLACAWAQAIACAFACLALGWGGLPWRAGFAPVVARCRTATLAMFLVSLPWWSQSVVNLAGSASWREGLRTLATFFSPAALVTLPFADFDLATLGRMYGIMQGPVVPYPPHPLVAVAGYGLLAAAGFGLGALVEELRAGRRQGRRT